MDTDDYIDMTLIVTTTTIMAILLTSIPNRISDGFPKMHVVFFPGSPCIPLIPVAPFFPISPCNPLSPM